MFGGYTFRAESKNLRKKETGKTCKKKKNIINAHKRNLSDSETCLLNTYTRIFAKNKEGSVCTRSPTNQTTQSQKQNK